MVQRVRVGLIGREHSGKTTLLDVLDLSCLHQRLRSGLRFAIRDPLQLPRRLKHARKALAQLQSQGQLTTLHPETYSFSLLDGGRELVRLEILDAVGQNLTHPSEANREAIQAHLDYLRKADVLVQILPCPPAGPSAAEVQQLRDDLLYTEGYVRTALEGRQAANPCTLLTVMNRIDARYRDEADARERLPREILRWVGYQMAPLVRRADIGAAAIVPVSAFGFQRAVVARRRRELDTAPTCGEREWLLRDGLAPQPFNLTTLPVAAIVCALRHRPVEAFADVPGAVGLCGRLARDLEALGGWRIRLKDI
jgi:hypothetical protein